jgi:hypothetical protein
MLNTIYMVGREHMYISRSPNSDPNCHLTALTTTTAAVNLNFFKSNIDNCGFTCAHQI